MEFTMAFSIFLLALTNLMFYVFSRKFDEFTDKVRDQVDRTESMARQNYSEAKINNENVLLSMRHLLMDFNNTVKRERENIRREIQESKEFSAGLVPMVETLCVKIDEAMAEVKKIIPVELELEEFKSDSGMGVFTGFPERKFENWLDSAEYITGASEYEEKKKEIKSERDVLFDKRVKERTESMEKILREREIAAEDESPDALEIKNDSLL